MAEQTKLVLDFVDVYGNRIKDQVDLFLKHLVLSDAPVIRNRDASKRLTINGLDFTQGGTYRLLVYPRKYRPVSQFIQVNEDQTTNKTFAFPADPSHVTGIDAPAYNNLEIDLQTVLQNSEVEGFPGKRGADLYQGLDNIRQAGLLNISAKMHSTTFQNGHHVFSYMSKLTRLRGDRFFVEVAKDLRDEVKNSVLYQHQLFHEVSGSLHTPPPGYTLTDSFKTLERYGNLQLTFFANTSTLDFLVDADIDDAQGIEHIFQVIHNKIAGPTNPYDIHEILLEYQKIDPHYTLVI